ncbi:MAG: GNAT family N-acetyltransferase [Clostridia bacterium]
MERDRDTNNEIIIYEADKAELKCIENQYAEDFPIEERKTFEKLNVMLSDESQKYKLIIARYIEERERVAGYALVYVEEEMFFLDYFAVDKHKRSSGIGSIFIKKMCDCLYSGKSLVGEIERTNNDENSDENRRRRFYMKLGAVSIPFTYYMPTPEGKQQMEFLVIAHKECKVIESTKLKSIVRNAVSFVHSDLPHTQSVIETYISNIKDYKL